MSSSNDQSSSRPPYHPGVQAAGWIPPCWAVPAGQVPVWPALATNQFGQIVQQPICFTSQIPTVLSQQGVLQAPTTNDLNGFQPPYQFSVSEPAAVKYEEPQRTRNNNRGGIRGRRSGGYGRGQPRLYRSRQEIERDRQSSNNRSVSYRAPHTEAEKEEIRQWIEQRRKNYPRQENPAVKDGGTNSERAQELKEILTRQQNMGVANVAGTDGLFRQISGNRPDCARKGLGGMSKRKRFDQGEYQGRRILQNGSFGRKHVVRKPMSLLEKLLYKETRCQKSHALQCIRFFVENNFLQDLGKKALVFPCETADEKMPLEISSDSETDAASEKQNDVQNTNTLEHLEV